MRNARLQYPANFPPITREWLNFPIRSRRRWLLGYRNRIRIGNYDSTTQTTKSGISANRTIPAISQSDSAPFGRCARMRSESTQQRRAILALFTLQLCLYCYVRVINTSLLVRIMSGWVKYVAYDFHISYLVSKHIRFSRKPAQYSPP